MSSRTGTMTKAALQKELRKKQIKFDSTALKADLVKLYELEILKNAAGFSTDDDEPSVKITRSTQMSCKQEKESTAIQLKSDESGGDYIRRSPRKSKRTRRLIEEEDEVRMIQESKSNRLSISLQRIDKMMNDDISDLTDKQLTKELKKHGIEFGPVGPTTRKVYERKLRAAMAEAKEETPVPAQEYSDQEPSEEEEEEEEEEVIEVVKTPGTITRSQRQKTLEESKSSSRSEKMKVSFEESVISDQGDHSLEEPIQTPKSMSFSETFGDSPGPIAAVDAGHTPYRRPGLAKLPGPLSSPISTLTHDLLSSRLPRSEYTRRIKAICDSATKRRPLHRRRQSEEETIVKEPVKPEPQCKMAKSSSRMPATVQFAILIAIAAFLYFVYITMEENPRLLPFGKEK